MKISLDDEKTVWNNSILVGQVVICVESDAVIFINRFFSYQ